MRAVLFAFVLSLALATGAAAQPRQQLGREPMERGFAGGEQRGGHMRMRERFRSANITHDGHLTLGQAQAAQMPNLSRHFNEIDTDHKGYITMDDVRSWHQRQVAQRGGAPASAPAGAPSPSPEPDPQ